MALTSEDVEAIGKLLDERLAAQKSTLEAVEAANRAKIQADLREQVEHRRMLWRVALIAFLLLLGAGCWIAVKVYNTIHAQITAGEAAMQNLQKQLSDTKIAYQTELKQNKEWQKERDEAAKTTKYDSKQSQASFDAGLVAKTFALLNKANQVKERAKTATGDDEADLEAQMQGLSDTTGDMTNILMQLMLHETDPAHDSPNERAAVNDSHERTPTPQEQAVPLQGAPAPAPDSPQTPPATVTQAGTPAAVPAPAAAQSPAPAPGAAPDSKPKATPLAP